MTEAEREQLERYVYALSADETLALHQIVSRRAAYIYGARDKAKQQANFKTAMGIRDTRFQPGLTVRENITRCMRRPFGGTA